MPSSPSESRRCGVAALAAAIATLAFLLPWWNRHLGLSLDGYMPFYGALILRGEIPYRDFFLHLPPLQPLAEAALQVLVGRSLLAVRIVGALGRIALAGVTAAWLARRFRPGTAVAAALVGIVLLSSDDTEILDLYNQWASLAAVVSGWLAAIALGRDRDSSLLWLGSGIAAALSFWTKQTIGLGAIVAVPAALVALSLRDAGRRRKLVRGAELFLVGAAVPTVLLGAWLALHHALGLFVQDVFRAAAASKGSSARLLIRPWLGPFQLPGTLLPATIGLIAAVTVLVTLRFRGPGRSAPVRPPRLAALTLALAFVAVAALKVPRIFGPQSYRAIVEQLLALARGGILFGSFGAPLLALGLAATALRRALDQVECELLLFSVVASAIATTHALSSAVGGANALPAASLLLALALDGVARRRWLAPARAFPIALCIMAALAAVGLHSIRLFAFAQWREPWLGASVARSSLPELAGLRLAPDTRNVVDGLVDGIRTWTRPGDRLMTFPVYPIFNWLADRPPATFAILHWIDVTPDPIADRDLAKLRADPPPAVLWQWIPEKNLALQEYYFRHGRPSGMRRMRDGLAELLASRYVLASSYPPPARNAPPLELWLRRDRAAQAGIDTTPP